MLVDERYCVRTHVTLVGRIVRQFSSKLAYLQRLGTLRTKEKQHMQRKCMHFCKPIFWQKLTEILIVNVLFSMKEEVILLITYFHLYVRGLLIFFYQNFVIKYSKSLSLSANFYYYFWVERGTLKWAIMWAVGWGLDYPNQVKNFVVG